MDGMNRPTIGIIGGSGFQRFLDDAEEREVTTPYGPPSSAVAIGLVQADGGPRSVAFVSRHGPTHAFPAHRVNYRANLWALRKVGVRQVIAPCAVGSLRADLGPGSLVVPDQLVDRTTSRVQTYFDAGACHVGFADPYCPRLRWQLLERLGAAGAEVVDGGTMVVVEGPRFSTRAESQWFAAQGWSLVNMTGHPEAVLARELGLCYSAVALVTDFDAGLAAGEGVSQADVFAVFGAHVERLRALLSDVVGGLPLERTCECTRVHDGMTLPIELP
jgi:5'-methylthioadenosine phosphorylase